MYDQKIEAFENITIGELNLAVLGRAYRIIRMFTDRPVEGGGNKDRRESGDKKGLSLRMAFFNWLSDDDSPYAKERAIALRMLFDEILEAPEYLKKVDKILRRQFEERDEKENQPYKRQEAPRAG